MENKFLNKVRYFFWVLSGSNIELLKKCATDYNRHANIGLAILVTTIMAFLTGNLAGYEFGGQNIGTALLFGSIWALLVFTIDRTMVLTLKKKPELSPFERGKSLIIPVIYRLILSGIISFFISIPLELWIFRENISNQMDVDISKQIIEKRLRSNEEFGAGSKKAIIKSDSIKLSNLDILSKLESPPGYYRGLAIRKNKLANLQRSIGEMQRTHDLKEEKRKSIWKNVPFYIDSISGERINDRSSRAHGRWRELKSETDILDNSIEVAKSEKLTLESNIDGIVLAFNDSITRVKDSINKTNIVRINNLQKDEKQVDVDVQDFEDKLRDQGGFTTKWVALTNIENKWVVFFIWFVRIVFFTIEMLPTMAKISTPIGMYDWAVYREEQKKEKLWKAIEDDEVEELKYRRKEQLKKESGVQLSILQELAEKQKNIARKILVEWERLQISKVRKNLNDFISKDEEE